MFFIFIPIWGRFPIWWSYFSKGLKPPTSNYSYIAYILDILVSIHGESPSKEPKMRHCQYPKVNDSNNFGTIGSDIIELNYWCSLSTWISFRWFWYVCFFLTMGFITIFHHPLGPNIFGSLFLFASWRSTFGGEKVSETCSPGLRLSHISQFWGWDLGVFFFLCICHICQYILDITGRFGWLLGI